MNDRFSTSRDFATGAAVGAVIPGLGGRLATAGVAVVLGVPANLGAAGLVESMFVGSICGLVGTMVLRGEDRRRTWPIPRGVFAGIVVFLASVLVANALGHGPDLGRPEGRVTTLVAATVFVLFGLALGRAVPRRRSRHPSTR